MLTFSQLALAVSSVLAVFVVMGWCLHWIWIRVVNRPPDESERLLEMTRRLRDAGQARDRAEDARMIAEAEFTRRMEELQNETEAMRLRLGGVVEEREAELARALQGALADSEKTMTGLRNARERIAVLERELNALRAEREG